MFSPERSAQSVVRELTERPEPWNPWSHWVEPCFSLLSPPDLFIFRRKSVAEEEMLSPQKAESLVVQQALLITKVIFRAWIKLSNSKFDYKPSELISRLFRRFPNLSHPPSPSLG